MASIAFLSDDTTASQCALMTAIGLAEIGVGTLVALAPGSGRPRPQGRPALVGTMDLAKPANAYEVERATMVARRAGADLVAAIPLAHVGDAAVRANFDAVITVGGCQAAAARALRAARYDAAADAAGRPAPPWFLARSDQPVLMTKARLSSVGGPRLPFAARAVPFAMPRMGVAECDALLDWNPGAAVVGNGILLAALVLAIAAAPAAPRLEAADLARMMALDHAGNGTRLADLARAYARVSETPAAEARSRTRSGSRDRRHVVGVQVRATREAVVGPARRTRIA